MFSIWRKKAGWTGCKWWMASVCQILFGCHETCNIFWFGKKSLAHNCSKKFVFKRMPVNTETLDVDVDVDVLGLFQHTICLSESDSDWRSVCIIIIGKRINKFSFLFRRYEECLMHENGKVENCYWRYLSEATTLKYFLCTIIIYIHMEYECIMYIYGWKR